MATLIKDFHAKDLIRNSSEKALFRNKGKGNFLSKSFGSLEILSRILTSK